MAKQRGVALDEVIIPAEGVVHADYGVRIHYLEWPGCRIEPTLVFLHGGGLHAHTFDLVGSLLRRHAHCIAIDLRGHGDSDWSETEYGSDAIAADLSTVVDQLHLKHVVVVGHSLGGMGAMAWAARRPPGLAGLVVLDVGPGMDDGAAASVNDFIITNPTFSDLEEVDNFISAAFPGGNSSADGVAANLRWDDDGLLTFKYDAGQFHPDKIVLSLGDDMRAVARQIDCPTVILRGSRSKVLSREAAEELAGLIPGASWAQVSDAGHTIQSSNPVGLAEKITGFLSELAPAEGADPGEWA